MTPATMPTDSESYSRLTQHAIHDCRVVMDAPQGTADARRRAVEAITDELREAVAECCPTFAADADRLAYRLLLAVH